ncbi:MarR family transcriptional regulator [Agrilactobacillus composti DSM 18527 = JCM 14202]|uniref:MarR family transcriptional regulator n=1 Tax=Agrilactobacillus composti DSM 18527 = JCM 14202 TaxID=1423734 RepID=X0QT94_9LACO|nr:winged helix DNA-binding protein [Agrilactobacillus composti]KRM34156.1 MarR family transcriptional regulator [Agrilactobacillus composti DSM 18527 = JCM 14202]GAF41840.1 transcriptional regulator, MarR family [Agrilactobacillus composti DSM 18527 = JCM 14202]
MFTIIRRIGAITRLIEIDSNQHFKPLKLNNDLFIYIIRAVEQPGMFLAQLADAVQIDRTTSFRTVKSLVKRGYLTLKNDPDNLKIKRVYPTEKAQAIYPTLHAYEVEKSQHLLAQLSKAEQATLAQLLQKLQV